MPREHGTERGYQQHRRKGSTDPACGPCLEAHRMHNKPSRDKWRKGRRSVHTPSTAAHRDIPDITAMSTGCPERHSGTIDVMETTA